MASADLGCTCTKDRVSCSSELNENGKGWLKIATRKATVCHTTEKKRTEKLAAGS